MSQLLVDVRIKCCLFGCAYSMTCFRTCIDEISDGTNCIINRQPSV